jgi:hypothetical protein
LKYQRMTSRIFLHRFWDRPENDYIRRELTGYNQKMNKEDFYCLRTTQKQEIRPVPVKRGSIRF